MTDRKLGDVGTDFLFENEHVKTWSLVLEPGQSSDWHQHHTHYLFIVTEAGTLKAEYDDGTESVSDYVLGQVVMGQKNSIHRVTNIGSARYSNSIVELKKNSRSAVGYRF